MTFKDLQLADPIIEAIGYMGFENATPIQELAIPQILAGKDLIACAQTGTGKTAAFVLPIIHKMSLNKNRQGTNTLIIVPTRELAIQIHQQIQGFTYFVDVHSAAVYGGGDGGGWEQQKEALSNGTEIIVATPGKLLSHLMMGYVKFNNVQHLILDEADRMMDMGFVDDIQKIITHLPAQRQNLMFSATMAPKIRTLTKTLLHDPIEISLSIAKPAAGVTQQAYLAHDTQKAPLVRSIIKNNPEFVSILVFTSTKKKVFDIVRSLRGQGYTVNGISSDLDQDEREKVLQQFTNKSLRVLVATDVLSRGIDIKDINLVVNYDVPRHSEDYVHRIGRTARSETKGMAITLICERDMRLFHQIERLIESEVPKMPLPEGFEPGPEWSLHHKPQDKNLQHGGKRKFGKRPPRKEAPRAD